MKFLNYAAMWPLARGRHLLGGVKERFKGQLILLPFHGICITDQLNCYVHVIFFNMYFRDSVLTVRSKSSNQMVLKGATTLWLHNDYKDVRQGVPEVFGCPTHRY